MGKSKRGHAVCIPYPAQGHINPMLKLAKVLNFNGFHISFVNTEYNHKRLLNSRGPIGIAGLPDFNFHSIPDGLSLPTTSELSLDSNSTQDTPSLCFSTSNTCLSPVLHLLRKLNSDTSVSDHHLPPVTCIVADVAMFFTIKAAEEIGVPIALFWTVSACGGLAYMHLPHLVANGLVPLKDPSDVTNGYLETTVDWIPNSSKRTLSLKSFPSFIRTTNPEDIMLNYLLKLVEQVSLKSSIGLILNTFESLEPLVLSSFRTLIPTIFTIGPLHLLTDEHHITDQKLRSLSMNLWKEDDECTEWLNLKQPGSVVYVNFGSITVMSSEQLLEFAWGLANSHQSFFWVIRPDLVRGESAVLPPEFFAKTKDRGLLGSWCSQEQVLKHPAIGGFLTHNGWNSTIESICSGVPMLCWPFFAEQQINAHYCCTEWGIGMEISVDSKRDEVEKLVRMLMEEDKGKEMKKKAMEWKFQAEEAIKPGGSSFKNLEELVSQLSNN